jgi:uncharacterized membrane protein YeaQ/YmgE (transglycosylase-associated protein family)
VGSVEFFYLLAGYLFVAYPSPSNPLPDPQFEIALITAVAVGYGLILALLAGWRGHRRFPWLLVGFAATAILGLVGAGMATLVFPLWLWARIRVRRLTPDEIEAVENMPGALGQSWYLHGRGYWLYRVFVIFGLGLLLFVAAWAGLVLVIVLAQQPARGYQFLPENSIVEQLSRRWFVISILVAVNAWSAWVARWKARDKLERARGAPLDIPLWQWHRRPRPLSKLGYGLVPLVLIGELALLRIVGRRVALYVVIVVALVVGPWVAGYLAVDLFLYGRRELPLEPVWRERTEARLKALAEPKPEPEPQLDSAWVRRHGRPGVADRRGRRERSAGSKPVV